MNLLQYAIPNISSMQKSELAIHITNPKPYKIRNNLKNKIQDDEISHKTPNRKIPKGRTQQNWPQKSNKKATFSFEDWNLNVKQKFPNWEQIEIGGAIKLKAGEVPNYEGK